MKIREYKSSDPVEWAGIALGAVQTLVPGVFGRSFIRCRRFAGLRPQYWSGLTVAGAGCILLRGLFQVFQHVGGHPGKIVFGRPVPV